MLLDLKNRRYMPINADDFWVERKKGGMGEIPNNPLPLSNNPLNICVHLRLMFLSAFPGRW